MSQEDYVVIALVGMPGSGKSEACSFFKQKNIPVVRFGEVTDEGLKNQGLPLSEEYEKNFREKLREEMGFAAFAIKSEPKIRIFLSQNKIVVVDGLRSWEEYEYLKNKFKKLFLLAIYASPKVRHQRLKDRKERSLTEDEARARDIAEIINLHMAPPIALSDCLIKNEGTVQAFYIELEKLLEDLIN